MTLEMERTDVREELKICSDIFDQVVKLADLLDQYKAIVRSTLDLLERRVSDLLKIWSMQDSLNGIEQIE